LAGQSAKSDFLSGRYYPGGEHYTDTRKKPGVSTKPPHKKADRHCKWQ